MPEPGRHRLKSYEKVHLRGVDETASPGERISILQKKSRNKIFMFLLNLLAIFFFAYSWYFGITEIGNTIFLILLAVFAMNVLLIMFQRRQIQELIDYYRTGNSLER